MRKFLSLIAWIATGCTLFSQNDLETDYAIFLFDQGEKNMVASMLRYAQQQAPEKLQALAIRIVFMGPSQDAKEEKPFCELKDKGMSYQELGVQTAIDRHWKREQRLSNEELAKLCHLKVRKKVWVGVASALQGQILEQYQAQANVQAVALRDNPNPDGDSDYFTIAREVQKLAPRIAVPSKLTASAIDSGKQVAIIGHGPTEEYIKSVHSIDRQQILGRLGLKTDTLKLIYLGSYGDSYESCFLQFLQIVASKDIKALALEVLIIPHPRYQGIVEKKLLAERGDLPFQGFIAGFFEKEEHRKIQTAEALAIADFVVVCDATSTSVLQAGALGKKVLYIHPKPSAIAAMLEEKEILQSVASAQALSLLIQETEAQKGAPSQQASIDIFEKFGLPRQGAQLLWEELLKEED